MRFNAPHIGFHHIGRHDFGVFITESVVLEKLVGKGLENVYWNPVSWSIDH